MNTTVLITGVGGGGSNNLIESLRLSDLPSNEYRLIGSNLSPEVLAKSPLDENFLLPAATEDEYPSALRRLIEREGVDLVIPNNDREVGRISDIRDELPCRTFLPHPETVALCHDKYRMYDRLSAGDVPVAKTYEIQTLDDIDVAMERLEGERFWVRPKTGSGSRGATWVETADQARAWIGLWVSLRGYRVEQFTISEFLPGRDYCFQSVWKDGRLLVGKLCERLSYFFGENKLSGMSSTPAVAVTRRDEAALENIFASIRLLDERPNGNFSFDLKGRGDGVMCVTECNIGRFCMITPIFDRTGRYNTARIHLLAALNRLTEIPEDPIDIEEDCYLIRELDTLPTIVKGQVLKRFERIGGDVGPMEASLLGSAAAWGRND